MNEKPDFMKFITGFIPGVNTLKAVVQLFQISLVLCGIWLAIWGWSKIFHKKMPILPQLCITNNTGTVHSSVDDNRRKTCFLSLCF